MSLKLDELRKRLLQHANPGAAAADSIHLPQTSSPRSISTAQPVTIVEIGGPLTDEAPPIGRSIAVEPRTRPADAPPAVESPILPERSLMKLDRPPEERVDPPVPRASRAIAQPDGMAQHQLADAVAKVFEQTKSFRLRFDDLAQNIKKLESISQDTARLIEPLRSFHLQLAQLAESFEAMRAFRSHLAQLGDGFEPMKLLQGQLTQLTDSFQEHLAELITILDPAKDFRDRIVGLAHSFDEVIKLHGDFGVLFQIFSAAEPEVARADNSAAASQPAH